VGVAVPRIKALPLNTLSAATRSLWTLEMLKQLIPSTALSIRGHRMRAIDESPPMANEWLAQLSAIGRPQRRKGQAGNLAKQHHLPVQVRHPPVHRMARCLFKSFIASHVKQIIVYQYAFVLTM
jgi:hypothetical protein